MQWAPAEARCLRQLRRQDRVLHTWVLPAALKVSSCEVLPRMCLRIEVTNSQGEGSWASWQPWNIPATLAVSQTRSCRLPAFKTHTQAAATGARPRCRSLGRCALLYDDQVADAISASGVACSDYRVWSRVWSHGNTNRLYDVRWAENGLSTRKSGVHSHGDCDGAQK